MGETNFPLVIAVGISLITLVLWSLLKKKNAVGVGEPPMLPGALPFLGHVVSLVRDANALHMYARCVFYHFQSSFLTLDRQWTRDLAPVSISLVGQRVYVSTPSLSPCVNIILFKKFLITYIFCI
jgi:LPXTG-motif cell wall-anchored protein